MKVFKCDICSEYFDSYKNQIRNKITRLNDSYYDICPKCQEKLEALISNKFKNIEITELEKYDFVKLRDFKIGDYIPGKGYIVEISPNEDETEYEILYSDKNPNSN